MEATPAMLALFAEQDAERERERERVHRRRQPAQMAAAAAAMAAAAVSEEQEPAEGSSSEVLVPAATDLAPHLLPTTGPKKMIKPARRQRSSMGSSADSRGSAGEAAFLEHPRPRVGTRWGGKFGAAHGSLQVDEGGALVTQGPIEVAGYHSALCGGDPMRSGVHFVEFTLIKGDCVMLGLARADFDPSSGAATDTADGWGFFAQDGSLRHGGLSSDWNGRIAARGHQASIAGNTVGLLLNLRGGEAHQVAAAAAAAATSVQRSERAVGGAVSTTDGARRRFHLCAVHFG